MSSFTLLHILGVAFGLGIATGMDLLLAKHIITKRTLTESRYNVLEQLSRIVTWGLILLWISGIGFLWKYQQISPEKLLNPKIWSKLMIVSILTINGIFIHHYLLPKLKRCIGTRVDHVCDDKEMAMIFSSGAISMVSWYIPFIYGTVPQLNFAFSFTVFTTIYLSILAIAVCCALGLLKYLFHYNPGIFVHRVMARRKQKREINFNDSFSSLVKNV